MDAMHIDPVAFVVFALAVILVAMMIGGHLAMKLGQPAVVGELFAGILLGNLSLLGFDGFEEIKRNEFVEIFARVGVLILLFEIGLESTVAQMMKVGRSALLVAILGVAAPMLLGWGIGALLLPDSSVYVHLFIGATLSATSVGITARVLQDLGRSDSSEARIILGAAVIDDVLGLIVLAVIVGIIEAAGRGASLPYSEVLLILGKAILFLLGALIVGTKITPRVFYFASFLRSRGVLLLSSLSFCFLMAWLSTVFGLAPIVGAFAAGLVLEDLHFKDFIKRGERTLHHDIKPIANFLVPIFFGLMGMRTDLRYFANLNIVALALALTAVAIIGKQVCALGVIDKGVNRLAVGIGMIPRGEVGLIFANIGLTLHLNGKPVVDQGIFSAIVVMVIVTSLAAPPALKWSFERGRSKREQLSQPV